MKTTKEIFTLLPGTWKLYRKISHHPSSFTIAEGMVYINKIKVDPNSLHYKEEVILSSDEGEELEATREYFYRYTNDEISVFFNQTPQKLFYKLAFPAEIGKTEINQATGDHLCIADNYKALYEFIGSNCFKLTYDVQGPQKDYRIHNLFIRR